MKKYLFTCRHILVTSIVLMFSYCEAFAGDGTYTYYIKAGVKVKEGNGKVYISETKQTPSEGDYVSSMALSTEEQNMDKENYFNYPVRRTFNYYAKPEPGYYFDHWTDASGNFLSNENPMSWFVLRTTSNSTTYYQAVFSTSEPAAYDNYYRAKSVSSSKYMSLVGEKFNFQSVVGSASSAYDNPDAVVSRASNFIKQDIVLTDNYISNPSTVFSLRKSVSATKSDITGQGISLINFTTGIFHGTNAGDNKIVNKGLETESSENGLKVKMYLSCSGIDLEAYVYETSGKVAASRTESSEWILEPLTEESRETSYFGAAPLATVTDGSKYYTTMYTAFPYKLTDGVKAYYVKAVNNSRAQCVEIKDIVPAYTAVILECNSTEPKENRLVPSPQQVKSVVTPEENMLKGVIDIDKGWVEDIKIGITTAQTPEDKYRTANNQETMRVLNVNSKGQLGFYKYGGTYMNSNKCYLDVSSVANAKSFTLQFVEGETTGISEVRTLDKSHIRDGHYYDLQGRRVENPSHGLYIINGKKVYIK